MAVIHKLLVWAYVRRGETLELPFKRSNVTRPIICAAISPACLSRIVIFESPHMPKC